MKLTALVNVWQAADWIVPCLDNLYNQADHIVITEACWVNDPRWVSEKPDDIATSPDGTDDLIYDYIKKKDRKQHKISFNQAGLVRNQPEARNSSLYMIPGDTDWIFIRDTDEFFLDRQWQSVRQSLEEAPPSVSHATFEARCFYFDFSLYKTESFSRAWKWFGGNHCYAIASFISKNNKGIHLLQDDPFFHYSYVSKKWTELKAAMGEDLEKSKYEDWWNNVYSLYDGTKESLDKIYSLNSGVHCLGGGKVDHYSGEHPKEVQNHPLRYWK